MNNIKNKRNTMSKLEKRRDTSLELIRKSGILTQEDLESVNALAPELSDTFLKVQMFRTPTEMRVSVLNDLKHPTADSKYWQSVREQNVMYTEMVNLSYEYRKALVDIKKLERDIALSDDELDKEYKEIELEQKEWGLLNMEKTAKARIGELNEWSKIKAELEEELNFSDKDVDEHQLMSYATRFINQYNVKGTNGSPSENANLIGQMESCLRQIHRKDLTEKFLDMFGEAKYDVAGFLSQYIPIPDEMMLKIQEKDEDKSLEEILNEDPLDFINKKEMKA